MSKDLYVKTYDLCTGEIKIGNVNAIFDDKRPIEIWSSTNELRYENDKENIKIEYNTMIWDEINKRYVMSFSNDRRKGYACFSTIVVDKDEDLFCLLIDDEKVKYCWEW